MGDTTYLDYKKIVAKREDYGPIGNGGNGLILHTTLAVDPDFGQPFGLLWEKLWHREKPSQLQEGETVQHIKKPLKFCAGIQESWRVEEYHKILKSGCQAESYRLGGESMATLLGFLTVIASHLLRMTYLHRNSPDSPAVLVLTPVQIDVLLALTPAQLKNPGNLTIDWALRAIARLGGYARTSAKNCNWHPSVMARMVATRVSMPWLAVTPKS